ncbi:MAG: TerB N-terminal domain-containing protein [Candidatus Gastranaerophilales bacterium]|nr:TerB N-terminal domain-containing protein [Candidatus Gastranaerophilales bacterium]
MPKLKFYSKNDSVELFGYTITDSLFYTCTSESDMPFAIDIKSTPTFGYTPSEGLNYWPNYNQISKSQQGFYIKWLAEGKPFVEELGYAYIYYYGLEYRALVEKQDLKDVLFEVIDLVNKFKCLRYGYELVAYLILSIKDFSLDEIGLVLKFLKENEQYYTYNPAYNSIIKNLTPAGQYKVKFSPYQFLNNNEYNNLSDRKNELLSYYFDKITENLEESDDVVVVEKGTATKKKGSKIPANVESGENVELKLDTEKLEKIKINTSEIHNVLQEIFAEEQAEILKSEPIENDNSEDDNKTEIENGLQNIINIIIEKENWTRNELLNVIQNKGMMLSSAIDEINEWSNEEFGDFLVEEDDDIYLVNKDVVNLIKK